MRGGHHASYLASSVNDLAFEFGPTMTQVLGSAVVDGGVVGVVETVVDKLANQRRLAWGGAVRMWGIDGSNEWTDLRTEIRESQFCVSSSHRFEACVEVGWGRVGGGVKRRRKKRGKKGRGTCFQADS